MRRGLTPWKRASRQLRGCYNFWRFVLTNRIDPHLGRIVEHDNGFITCTPKNISVIHSACSNPTWESTRFISSICSPWVMGPTTECATWIQLNSRAL